ncbi:putative secreted protein (Por secretion system target) [Lutibacter sp. Hel_I_33_5]|uniref:LamG-like jellyroll fold domain-containing protein n=1 Tax=Lutibacter sp. Hel_I_33_5 TaxID=1566289 RepID=UPI0011A87CEA|nr:LamG-like jellyroll fold domain-containing protein [Lutibacter sp. Hel_I_33_5]TVZ57252.1 putative secreted protein (Por secretion system target) [Lutibacter sp. Hel_I_33_5]
MNIKKIRLLFIVLFYCFIFNTKAQITQTLTGATTIVCPQDNTLTLQNSETNFNYFLRNDTTKEVIGNPQTGTGSALNFQTGIVSETTDFHVFAANPSYALTFDGVDDYVSIPHNASLNFSTGVTVEAWVHPTNITNGYQEIYRKEGTDAVGRILFSFQNNGTILSFGTHTTTDAYTELDVSINPADYNNQWVHILAFFDDATNAMRVYRNGVEIGNKASNGTLVNSANPQAGYIGSWNGTAEYFQGKIASLRVWNKALTTQQEIQQAKDNVFVGDETNLVAYYPFFENAGTQLTDSSTNANNGTINGATWSTGTTGGVGKVVSNTQTITVNLPTIIYVDKSATGSNNGSSWANAFTSIQPAVTAATENQEIRIAQGAYNITNQISITKALVIKGGYAIGGSCTQDIANNPTIIDAYEFANNNKQRVINATHTTGTLFLEGVTIQNGDTFNSTFGGGGIATVGNLHLSFVTIKNCKTRVGVNSFGGAIYSLDGNITLNNTILNNNTTDNANGGGIYTDSGDILITNNSQITNNSSSSGGGIYTSIGSITLTNSQVTNNTSSSSNVSFGGGIYNSSGSITLTNSQVSNNTSSSSSLSAGGGIFNSNGSITLTNSQVTNNTSSSSSSSFSSEGGGIHTNDGLITLTNSVVSSNTSSSSSSSSSFGGVRGTTILQNSILWGNTKSTDGGVNFTPSEHSGTLTANYSLIKNQNPTGTANIDATVGGFNPLFVDEANGDYRLQTGSPLINAGLDSYNTTLADLDNNVRKVGVIDIGAYEFNGATNANTSWTGATNTLWQEPTNWNNGVPNANSNVTIPTGLGNYPTVTNLNNATAFNLDNQTGASVIINAGKGLTIENNLTNNGTITVHSNATNSGALVVKGSASGNITYNRYVTDNWHTVGTPVIGQTIQDVAENNQVIQNGDNTKYAIAPYNNDIPSNNWEYVSVANVANVGNFVNGKGYSMKRNPAGTYSFTGAIENSDKQVALTEGSKNNWNLIANPYPSFLKFNNLADASSNLLLQNVAQINSNNLAVYIWDTTTSGYKPYNHASTNLQYIAPGQAFFVNAKSGGGTFTFSKSLQTTSTQNVFAKTNNAIFEINLSVSFRAQSRNLTKSTEIKYLPNTTKGLDVGYDAETFTAQDNSFSVYTHLLESNNNKTFALQCLPPTNFEEQIIPIGINADVNTTINFSVDVKNIPTGFTIYLEDKQENTFTKLNDNGNYEITVSEAQSGIGRFYLHTTNQVLDVNEFSTALEQTRIWLTEKRILKIANLQTEKATLKFYDLLGKEVFVKQLSPRTIPKLRERGLEIQLPNRLQQAVYLVRLQTEKGIKTTKIILD